MIFNYGFSVVGKSHIVKGTCCQDAHKIKKLDNGWYVAAVADGVGSAKNSQIGSKIAANTVVEFCAECMPWDYSVIGIKSMLRTAYNYAFKQIIKESEKSGEPIESYDTTLTVVIYDGHRIIYGHSGDGAIIGLTVYGDYVQITKPQKGVDMVSVLPLRSGYTVWSIDSYDEELVAVMLMTDGMLDSALCPYLLKLRQSSEVYTPIASFFADPYGISKNEKENKKIKEEIKAFIEADENYNSNVFYTRLLHIYAKHLKKDAETVVDHLKEKNYPIAFMQSVQDDKTLVALINTDIDFDTKETSYYIDPNWEELQEEWNKKAYPHLYQNESSSSSNDNPLPSSSDGSEKGNIEEAANEKDKEEIEKQSAENSSIQNAPSQKTNNKPNSNKQPASDYTIDGSLPKTISSERPNPNTNHKRPRKKGLIEKTADWIERGVNAIGEAMESMLTDDESD